MTLAFSHQIFSLGLPSSQVWSHRCTALGAILVVRSKCRSFSPIDGDYLHRIFEPSLRHGQIAFWIDHLGGPAAYAIYAYLSDEAHELLSNNPDSFLHHSDWAEGSRLCILDASVAAGSSRLFIKGLSSLFPLEDAVSFVRSRGGRRTLSTMHRATFERLIREKANF